MKPTRASRGGLGHGPCRRPNLRNSPHVARSLLPRHLVVLAYALVGGVHLYIQLEAGLFSEAFSLTARCPREAIGNE